MPSARSRPRSGSGPGLMTLGALAFVGYAVIFFVRNFTDSFLELGIGPGQVSVGKGQIEEFSPSLYNYISHLPIAASRFLAATAVACSGSRSRLPPTTRTASTRSGTSG